MGDRATEFGYGVDSLSTFERVRLTWRLLNDGEVATWMKATVPVIALAYLISPIDFIPDMFLGLGQIDDVSVLGIAIFAMTRVLPRLAPADRVASHLAAMRGATAAGEPERGRAGERDVIDTRYVVNQTPAGGARPGASTSRGEQG